ncbi:GrpB family protein [Hyphomicrobium sp.]|uniref:GrpB family protein n=1 Tax=Hyphomicrobium sp. TaxID=82 RepID=UPI002E350590|nr:GrpB family protein [Hyphomicrobium sp.]HEX2842988.1 GrpB family protein [Hyphomicrobium sp.]
MSLPLPIQVELLPHDPRWAARADEVSAALSAALGPIVVTVHHVGSTAIPGMSAKPILDLIPVVPSLPELDRHRNAIEAIGYEWWGELGLPGRRYCTKTDPHTGRRLVQLHCYEIGSSEIDRHLAFRDYLRQRPDVARAYDREKARCRSLHTDDSHAYSDCKNAWIKMVETEALVWYRS